MRGFGQSREVFFFYRFVVLIYGRQVILKVFSFLVVYSIFYCRGGVELLFCFSLRSYGFIIWFGFFYIWVYFYIFLFYVILLLVQSCMVVVGMWGRAFKVREQIVENCFQKRKGMDRFLVFVSFLRQFSVIEYRFEGKIITNFRIAIVDYLISDLGFFWCGVLVDFMICYGLVFIVVFNKVLVVRER